MITGSRQAYRRIRSSRPRNRLSSRREAHHASGTFSSFRHPLRTLRSPAVPAASFHPCRSATQGPRSLSRPQNYPCRQSSPLERFHEDTRAPIVLPVGRAHAGEVLTSHAEIDRACGRRELFRPPPTHEAPGIGPCLPDCFARSIENASNDKGFPTGHFRGTAMPCSHCFSPFLSVRSERQTLLLRCSERQEAPSPT